MAAFPKMTLTNVGQALQTKVLAGAKLTFTRIALGDGQLNGQPISPLTNMIHQTASVPVDSVRVVSSNTCQASGFFSNADIAAGFKWRETGLFAQDPDVGEILYGYKEQLAKEEAEKGRLETQVTELQLALADSYEQNLQTQASAEKQTTDLQLALAELYELIMKGGVV